MKEYMLRSLEDLRWNCLRFATTSIRSSPVIPLTTELRVLVPQVDLEPLVAQAPEAKNEYAADPIAQWTTDLRPSLPGPVEVPSLDVRTEEGLLEENTVTLIPAETTNDNLWGVVEVHARPPQMAPDLLQRLKDWAITTLLNELRTLPMILNSLHNLEVSTPLRPSRRLQLLLEELSRELRKREEQIESGLMQVAQRVSAAITPLITPPPRRAPGAVPVRVRGRVPHRGAIRTHGEVVEEGTQLTGVVLDEAWKPEKTLSLSVEEGPEVREGRLTLVLRGEEAHLVGRRADLVLKSEWLEVALGSAEICEVKGEERWKLAFELDLTIAGLKVREGTLPPKVLQVVIEPAQGPAKRQSGKRCN